MNKLRFHDIDLSEQDRFDAAVEYQDESKGREIMNTFDFIVGQLLSFEMMQLMKHRPRKPIVHLPSKDQIMENQLLVIALLIVSLVANFTVMASPEK